MKNTFRGVLRRPVSERIQTEDGRGWTSRVVGQEEAEIIVEIDVEALIRSLGAKAMRSKRRVSRGLSGQIVVRAKNVRRIA